MIRIRTIYLTLTWGNLTLMKHNYLPWKAVILFTAIVAALCIMNVTPSYAANVWKNFEDAEQARASGKHQAAIDKYKTTIQQFLEMNDHTNVALMYNKMAESQQALTLYDDAVS